MLKYLYGDMPYYARDTRMTKDIIEKGDYQKLTEECKKALEIIKKYKK